MVAAAQGGYEHAEPLFVKAADIHRRYRAPFEEAETLHYWARVLLAAGDRVRALQKLDGATELYRRHGAGEPWLQRVQADRARAQSAGLELRVARALEPAHWPAVTRDGAAGAAGLAGIFLQQGEYWTLSWAGHESRLKHRKGFDYLVRLLQYPGREFAAADLTAAIDPGVAHNNAPTARSASEAHQANATIARGLGDAGAARDATAKVQHRRRLEDLRAELEQAEQRNDLGRAEQAGAEIEFIQAEVIAAVGLGGRDRKSASHAERARLAVTKAIKAALNRIRDVNPGLGRHLSLSIQTGYFCAYRPKHSVTWKL